MSEGPRLQVEIVQTDDSSRNTYVIYDPSTGNIAIDHSQYYERIAIAAEETRDILSEIRNAVTTTGIKFEDVYAALSYSSLIKVFEEENIDLDTLISKTQNKLSEL